MALNSSIHDNKVILLMVWRRMLCEVCGSVICVPKVIRICSKCGVEYCCNKFKITQYFKKFLKLLNMRIKSLALNHIKQIKNIYDIISVLFIYLLYLICSTFLANLYILNNAYSLVPIIGFVLLDSVSNIYFSSTQ